MDSVNNPLLRQSFQKSCALVDLAEEAKVTLDAKSILPINTLNDGRDTYCTRLSTMKITQITLRKRHSQVCAIEVLLAS